MNAPLPVDASLPALTSALVEGRDVLLRAPTGAGKTTRVPAAIDRAGIGGGGQVVMVEPRRLAARAAARRLAAEGGTRVGDHVGYQVRFDDRTSARTRIRVVTEGVFLRQIQADPFLEGVAVVVFDEFHERSLDADLALAMTRRVQADARPDLRLVVMSATLQTEPLLDFLERPRLIESEGRRFPVDVCYLPAGERPTHGLADDATIVAAVRRASEATDGDVLVFLPGVGEIRRLSRALGGWAARSGTQLFELYGDLPPEKQDEIFEARAARKVVLATNVAETSITLPGITAVVDTGVARKMVYDPALGLDRLELGPVSRASAEQRAGRAGRTQPGICLRLWSEHDERSRPDDDVPEVRRVDLAGAALQLCAWGEIWPERFAWFEQPSSAALARARSLLLGLGALEDRADDAWIATRLGKELARLPLHPRLARLLIAGAGAGAVRDAATSAAILAERSPFVRGGPAGHGRHDRHGRDRRVSEHDSDVLDALHALRRFEASGVTESPAGALHAGAARAVLRVRDQLVRLVGREEQRGDESARDRAVSQALLAAFPDRLARRRAPNDDRAVMVGGRGVRLARECGVHGAELFVCVDLDAGRGESLVRRASAVDREWLQAERVTTADELGFDEELERVRAVRRTSFEGLVLEERPVAVARDAASAHALAAAARRRPDRALGLDEKGFRVFSARMACLRDWMPELELPALDEALLDGLTVELCEGRLSFEELRRAPLLDALRARLGWQQLQAIDEHAPERIEIPSGSRVVLRYEAGRPPILAARIQELFGWHDGPTVAAGRVRVLLHLLAPNMRPQQVTDDLRSFWDSTYAEVRKDLRRRYPKHAWPEDPWTATPTRGAKRRRD